MADAPDGEASAIVRARVLAARERQRQRYEGTGVRTNAELRAGLGLKPCQPVPDGRRLLHRAAEQLGLSARGYTRVLKVARTIADLAASETVEADHVAEALQFRLLE
ncbi:MAG: ATP-binding protein [Gammaproteobacteria bacterium]